MKKIIITILQYVFFILFLPISVFLLIWHWVIFYKYKQLLVNAINTNDEFYLYLNKLNFIPDMLGRLYTVQEIPKEFSDFNDDELYDITMRSLLPMIKLIETNVLVDVISTIIKRINSDSYIVMLTPKNQNKLLLYLRCTVSSVLFYLIIGLLFIIF